MRGVVRLNRRASILSLLLPSFIEAFFRRIAHHKSGYVGLQQVVQPGGPGSFFKCDVQVTAQLHLINCRTGHAGFLSCDHTFHASIFPAPFITAIEMLSLCTSILICIFAIH